MRAEIYKRIDGKWAWRALAKNGQIVATDGGQGYENRIDAANMVRKLFMLPRVINLVDAKDEKHDEER